MTHWDLTYMHFLPNCKWTLYCMIALRFFFFFSFCSFIIGTISSHAVTLLPHLLPFLSSTLGHVLKCVCVCVCVCVCLCMHVWALFFFHIECSCVCVCVCVRVCVCVLDSQPICMEMKWNDRSCLRNEHFNGRYCWLFMGCCWGFDSVIWPGGELANLVFFHPLPSLSHFLYPLQGFTLLLFFSPSLLLIISSGLSLWP